MSGEQQDTRVAVGEPGTATIAGRPPVCTGGDYDQVPRTAREPHPSKRGRA